MAEGAPRSKLDVLRKNVDEYEGETYDEAWRWQRIYYLERSALIVFSLLASAKAISSVPFLASAQPYFAFAVSLITAFDVWLKPGARYRAFYVGNDDFAKLRQKLELLNDDDAEGAQKALAEFDQINSRIQSVVEPS